ncbi:hypothetical protein AB0F81_44015 [Actinoplanes sp. NPDC024001]|uniref:hypothetical protein n=1 Tax=Actinoplanes sp. NPDC024001 TaxID=3154598 RepID=UPI0033E113F5
MSAAVVIARTGRAEWARIWSVRSSWLFVLATAVAVLGIGAIAGTDASAPPPGATAWDGSRPCALFALFGILAMAVVTSTADHGTRGIVPTVQWTPRRGVLLAARAGVIVAVMTLLASVLVVVATVVVWALKGGVGLPAGEGARTVGDLAFVYASGALLAVGLGLVTHSTAAALVIVIALVLVLPLLVAQLPFGWTTEIATHLPGSGALFLIFGEGPSDDMTTTSARLTMAVWAVAALTAGGWRLLRTDVDR